MSKLYCVHITKTYPDYKRAYVGSQVKHFLDINEANEFRREEKRKYYESFHEYLRDMDEPVPKDIDNLDEDKAYEYIYSDSYMDMPPFDAELYEIVFDDEHIESKTIDFPQCDKIEGFESYEE
jgi:hypothetical protein